MKFYERYKKLIDSKKEIILNQKKAINDEFDKLKFMARSYLPKSLKELFDNPVDEYYKKDGTKIIVLIDSGLPKRSLFIKLEILDKTYYTLRRWSINIGNRNFQHDIIKSIEYFNKFYQNNQHNQLNIYNLNENEL